MSLHGKQRNAPSFHDPLSSSISHKKQNNVGNRKRLGAGSKGFLSTRSSKHRSNASQNDDTLQESLQTFDSPKQTNLFFSCYQEKTLLTSSVQENSLHFIEEERKDEEDLPRGHLDQVETVSSDVEHFSERSFDSNVAHLRATSTMIHEWTGNKSQKHRTQGSSNHSNSTRSERKSSRKYRRKVENEFQIKYGHGHADRADVQFQTEGSWERSTEAESSRNLSGLDSHHHLKTRGSMEVLQPWHSQSETIDDYQHIPNPRDRSSPQTTPKSSKNSRQNGRKFTSRTPDQEGVIGRVPSNKQDETLEKLNGFDIYQEPTGSSSHRHKHDVEPFSHHNFPHKFNAGRYPTYYPDSMELEIEATTTKRTNYFDLEEFYNPYGSSVLGNSFYTGKGIWGQGPDKPPQLLETDLPTTDTTTELLDRFGVITDEKYLEPSFSSDLSFSDDFMSNISLREILYSKDNLMSTLDTEALSSIPEETESFSETIPATSNLPQNRINSDESSINLSFSSVDEHGREVEDHNNRQSGKKVSRIAAEGESKNKIKMQCDEDDMTEILCDDTLSMLDQVSQDGLSSEELRKVLKKRYKPTDKQFFRSTDRFDEDMSEEGSLSVQSLGTDQNGKFEIECPLSGHYAGLDNYLDTVTLSHSSREWEMVASHPLVDMERQVKERMTVSGTLVRSDELSDPVDSILLKERSSFIDPALYNPNCILSNSDEIYDLLRNVRPENKQENEGLGGNHSLPFSVPNSSTDLSNMDLQSKPMQSCSVFHKEQIATSSYALSSPESSHLLESGGKSLTQGTKLEEEKEVITSRRFKESFPRNSKSVVAKKVPNEGQISDEMSKSLAAFKELPTFNQDSVVAVNTTQCNVSQAQLRHVHESDQNSEPMVPKQPENTMQSSNEVDDILVEDYFDATETVTSQTLSSARRKDARDAFNLVRMVDDDSFSKDVKGYIEGDSQHVINTSTHSLVSGTVQESHLSDLKEDSSITGSQSLHLSELEDNSKNRVSGHNRDVIHSPVNGRGAGLDEEGNRVITRKKQDVPQGRSEVLDGDRSLHIDELAVDFNRDAYSLPSKQITRERHRPYKNGIGREMKRQSESVNLRSKQMDFEGGPEMKKMSYSLTLPKVQASPKRSILQDISLLSGVGWTVRVRNVLRQTPKKNHSDLVAKAYWMKRWRIGTRVQKMIRLDEESQMQSAILFHDISLLYNYLTTWRQITREKLQLASDLYRRHLLTQGIKAMKRAVSQTRSLTEQLRGRLQQGQLRSSFSKWHSRTRLHQHHEQVAQLCFSRKRLRYMFLKWRVVYASRQKDRVASLHFKLCLLSTFFLKWKVFVSDQRVEHEQGELARVYREENLLKASWDTLKETYHKRMAANRQDRRYTLVKVMRAWRHGAQLCRMETIQLHQMAQGLRRVHLLRVHLLSWKEEVIVSKAERKIDRVKLCFAFHLWKLKLERKRLVNRIIASKRRRAIKLRVLTLWRQETIDNRVQRSQGGRVLQNFQKRRFLEAWRLLLEHNKERRGKLEDHIKMSKVTSMKKSFRQWRIKYNEKERSHIEEEARRRWLAEKFTARWRQVAKMRQEEIKADLFKETKRKKCLKVAFGTWIDAFGAVMDEHEKAMEAREYIEKHKLHRIFRCWRLAAREGVVIRPLVDRRRKKHLQRVFSSWYLLIQRKRMVKLMQEQSNRRMVTLSYFGWRQNYLEVLQLKVAKETLIQKHLSRLFRAWYLIGRNRKEAERLSLQRDQRILTQCFEVWRSKQEEADLKRERLKGHQMRSVILKRFYFRLWTERKRTGSKEESEAMAGVQQRRNAHSLQAAFSKWRSSYENEILARNHHLAVLQGNLRIFLIRWHRYAKLSFQHSLEVFTRSLGLSSPSFGTITPSDLSRRAQASEGSNYSDTLHLSVVDSGYHGNHANLESLSIGRFQNLSQSDFVDASNPSDLETISIQSCPLFSGTTAPSLMEDDGTFQSTEIAHTYSSADSSPDSNVQLERRDTLKPRLNQMDESYSQRIEGCPSAREEVKEINRDYTDGSTEYEYSYPLTGMTGTFSQGWRQHLSVGDSSHTSSLRLGCSDDESHSSSSCELVTVQDRLSKNNIMRDVWLGEMGDVSVGVVSNVEEDEDSLGMMSLQELVDEDTALTRSDGLETLSSFHDEDDDENCVTEEQQSKVVLIKYMLNFWRLWPGSAVFLQWLRYTRYRKYLRLQQDEFKKITMRNTLRRYTYHWRRQLELEQTADQHQQSSLIGKYFEALSRHHQMKKKSRLNREFAEKWRAAKSLSGPFQKWKSQVLHAHTVSGAEPSWDSFITKSRTLRYNSSKLEGKIQKENMKECFMFWKLRVWQQLQVRNQFQQTLKQRCFQSWLQWTRVNRERTIQMESFLQKRQKYMVLLRWKEALLHKSKVQQMRSKVNENHLRDILHLWHQYAQITREDREHTETAQKMVAMTALQHFWNIWRCQLKECNVAQSYRDQQLTKKCFGLWLNFKHRQIELRKSARRVEVIVGERKSREAFYIWRKRMQAKKRMLKLTINQEQTTLRISFEKWKEYVSLERREKMRCRNLMEEVVSHWLTVCHLQQKQRMGIQDAVSRWRRLVYKSRNLAKLQQDQTRLKSRNRLEHCWRIWREKFDKTSVADRFYESHLCSRYLHDWCIYTKQQKRRLADEESFRLRMQHRMVERCFSHWTDMWHDIQQKHQISADFADQRSQRALTVCFQTWFQQALTKKADKFYKIKVEKQMWCKWRFAFMNIQKMKQVQQSTERRRLQTSFNALQIWCSENKKQRLLLQSIRVKQERNRVRLAFSKWREQLDQRRNAVSYYQKYQLRRHFQAWFHMVQKEKHLHELYETALATFTYRQIQLVLYGKHDMIKYDREVLRGNASRHPSNKIIGICFERWKSRTTQRGKERLRLFSLAQSAAAHWRWWVEKRREHRQMESEKEQKAEAFSRRCLSLHVFKGWKKGVEQQKQERQRKTWLMQKYGMKWLNLTSQRIVAEQMEHYWKMRRGWNQWRQHLIKSLTSKKVNKNEERRLCAKVFHAWKMAAKHDQYYIVE